MGFRNAHAAGLLAVSLALAGVVSCGRKGAPAVPLPTIPSQVADLKAAPRCGAIEVSFRPPEAYLSGKPIEELSRFVIERRIQGPKNGPSPDDTEIATGDTVSVSRFETPWEIIAFLPARQGSYDPEPYTYEDTGKRFRIAGRDTLAELPLPADGDGVPLISSYLLPGYRYSYRVYAVDGKRRMADKSPSANAAYGLLPAAPEGLEAVSRPGGLLLTWEEVESDCTGKRRDLPLVYQVFRSLKPGTGARIGSSREGRYLDKSINDNQRAFYYVRAAYLDGEGPGPPSATVEKTYVDIFPPPAPEGLRANTGARSVTLFWQVADGVFGVLVERSVNGGPWEPLTEEPQRGQTFLDEALFPDTEYRYRLRAVDDSFQANVSEASEPVIVRLQN